MKILSYAREIEENLCELINKFKNISMSVAWASASSKAYKVLIREENKKKIQTSTVGLHFYQTHPDFIKAFLDDDKLKFYKKSDGVFHPKIYLFWNDERDWVCFTGSANFTQSALTKNDEIVTIFDSNDGVNFKEIKAIMESYYKNAETFKQEDLQGYKNIWDIKNKQKRNLDDFEPNILPKPLYKSSILSLSWDEYYSLLKKDQYFQDRLNLLAKANEYFSKNTFSEMSEEKRKSLSGANENRDGIKDWRLFGRMPIPRFIGRLATGDSELINISDSLDKIPNDEKITQKMYVDFLYYFKTSDQDFNDVDNKYKKAGWGYGVSPISRMLSMKRPNEFFCLTKANQTGLMKSFGIKTEILKEKSYERYWDEIIEPVRQSPWYNSEKPTDSTELQAWNGRVALMDALFYLQDKKIVNKV